MMQNTGADHVSDPVSHISISGIHGRKELEKRLASSPGQRMPDEPARVGRLVAGALIGAAVMYLLDPDRGPRRRSLVRDKFIRAGHSVSDRLGKLGRDIRNRAAGRVAETRGRFRSELVDDTILVDRVRSAIGHVVSHPGSIEVSATDGGITLSGPVLAHEVDKLLATARGVRGVREVHDNLEIHETAEGVPGLQSATI
jgi:hypothetical protein